MRTNAYKRILLAVFMLLFAWGCASRQPQVEPTAAAGGKTIEMKADSYKFEPNNIKVSQGDTVTVNVTNISDKQHNLTLIDPHGALLQSVELPPHKTVSVPIRFLETGTYDFYCNKPFHSTLGMSGHFVVGPRP